MPTRWRRPLEILLAMLFFAASAAFAAAQRRRILEVPSRSRSAYVPPRGRGLPGLSAALTAAAEAHRLLDAVHATEASLGVDGRS